MSATDELCRLLTEAGVEYERNPWSCGAAVWWRDSSGTMWRAHDNEEDELLSFYAYNSVTPEQAIAATLGRGTCKVEKELQAENAKLRELVRHMHTCMEHYESDGSVSCDRCPLDNDTGNCDYEQRMQELGIEVDA